MIAEGLLHGCSKPASTRWWHTTTLAGELSVSRRAGTDVDELYEAMDWLLGGQERIEKKPAARHLGEGAQASSSPSVQRKKTQRMTCDGLGMYSFGTLLEDLGALCRNRCRILADPSGTTFTQDTQPTRLQARVFQLLIR